MLVFRRGGTSTTSSSSSSEGGAELRLESASEAEVWEDPSLSAIGRRGGEEPLPKADGRVEDFVRVIVGGGWCLRGTAGGVHV